MRFAGPLHMHVAMAPVLLPIVTTAPRFAMMLPHSALAPWSPNAQGHQLAVALLTPPKQPAVASIRQVLADLGLESEHLHPLRLLTLASTVYLPMSGASIL